MTSIGMILAAPAVAVLAMAAGPAAAEDVAVWGPEGTWAFEPGKRLAGGVLDLRELNEKVAGESGPVRLSEDGNGFVRGDGEPVRFWGVAAHVNKRVSDAELDRHGRFLARVGVNMVRVGGASPGLMPQKKGADLTDVNEQFVKDVWRTVATMRKHGIYTRVAPFWDHGSVKHIDPAWGIEGYAGGDTLNALLFFEPVLQDAYKGWMKHLLTETNPHTGVALKDDPALAIVQIVSEDSIFFWWLPKVHGGPLKRLQRLFGEFAAGRHGSIDKALATWDGAKVEGDAPGQGRLGLYHLHNLIQWPGTGNRVRLRDQVAFLSHLERSFYKDMRRYLREELGVRAVIGASNFGPADDVRLGDLQRWDWAACDVIEQNGFFSTVHKGAQAFWRIDAGNFFSPRSALRSGQFPCLRKHVAGKPFVMSSTTWTPPNLYTTEGPVATAGYAAMGGMDGLLWFAAAAPVYQTQPYMTWTKVKGSHPMRRWTISTPGFISQFPAAAIMFRRGLIAPAETVVRDRRSVEGMIERRAPLLTESLDYDPAAHADEAPPAKRELMQRADPRALLVGRVETVYDADPAGARLTDIATYVEGENGPIRTTHGQLALHREKGLLQIDAPAAQGVAGFLKDAGGAFELTDVTIRSGNRYAAVVAVAMDGKPLKASRRVLVQVGTIARPTGWSHRPASRKHKGRQVEGLEIVSTGRMPWRVENADVELTIANPALVKATRLDELGYADREVPVAAAGGEVTLALPPDTLYLMLTAE